ncbi:MAG: PQQ-dependent sugar dehydrogenase [Thermoanaerobaculia bacterium]
MAAVFDAATLFAQTLPPGFRDSVVISGLRNPTVVQFASDGRVFVAEKSGLIKVFDSLNDTTPTVFADLRTNVHNYWDRGLLGMALHPNFPATPYVYVLYTHDAAIGGTAPRWGSPGGTSDGCPDPPGATKDGCVVSGRLSRLQASGDVMVGTEQVLIEDWFQQFPSHSIGAIAFGADGMLYASGGDGASFNYVDYGQEGDPPNPGGDPPVPVGGTQTPPTAEGGALRSQDLRTPDDPVTLAGSIIRVDPSTGAAPPDNPLASHPHPNGRRIVAYGLRNPFRFTIRPGTNEIWSGDVGWRTWEEINRAVNPTDSVVENFGWPCYEGTARQPGYDGAGLNLCENLYVEPGAVTPPVFEYRHGTAIVSGESCGTGSSSTSGLAFYSGGAYPASFDGALFFADYSRTCIWVMFPGAGGIPDPATRQNFVTGAKTPVELEIGPNGDLFYVDIAGGAIHRIEYFGENRAPIAVIAANPTSGPSPLTVQFDASGSSDPDGDDLTYAWDLDDDGEYDDASTPTAQRTYSAGGSHTVRLRVSDPEGASDTESVVIQVSNTAPSAAILSPGPNTSWQIGDTVNFSGSATDPEQGTLPASALFWDLILHHCTSTSDCHAHFLQDWTGVATGSFSVPEHEDEFPTHLELRLTATDLGGLQDTEAVRLDYQTVNLTFHSSPAGLAIAVGGATGTTPFTRTLVVNSNVSISAPSPQTAGGVTYEFASWSDGGAQTHNLTVPPAPATYTASFQAVSTPEADLSLVQNDSPDPVENGTTLTYTISVANAGPATATALSVTDTLPPGVSLVSATGTGWSCSGTTTVVCTRPSLAVGPAPALTIRVTAPSSNGPISNAASVDAAEPDPNTGNNSHIEQTAVTPAARPGADLSISKADVADPVCAESTLTWTLQVFNAGPSSGSDVVVTDTLPAGVTLLSAGGSGWNCTGGPTVQCTRPSLSVGAAPGITISVEAPSGAGPVTNAATVSSGAADPDNSDNSSTQVTGVSARPAPPTAGNDGPICVGETLSLTAATVAGAAYQWTGPNGFNSTAQNPTISNVQPSAAGDYSVTATVAGCPSPASVTAVTVRPLPSAAITAPSAVCAASIGNTASVPNAGAGASYDWSIQNGTITSGDSARLVTFTAGASGNVVLSVTVTNGGGCTAVGSLGVATFASCARRFHTVPPCRVIDTRGPTGSHGGPALIANTDREFSLAGRCGIPASAQAVSANVTVTQGTHLGHLRMRPAGTPIPPNSTINYSPGQTRANNAILPVRSGGDLAVYCAQAAGGVHFIVDVNGYFE